MITTSKASMKIRKAKAAEINAIVEIANRTFNTFYRPFLGDHNVDWYVQSGELKREIIKHTNDLYVVLLKNNIKGFVIYFNDFIHFMMIDADAHRSGMGSFMLKAVEEKLFENHNTIKLQSFTGNKIATNFYLKNGWTKGEVNNAHNNVEMVYFEKSK